MSQFIVDMSTNKVYTSKDTVEGGFHSPKLLENLGIDQFCRSLLDLDGDITLGHPQYIINDIVQSLVSHGALNEITLRSFRQYELDQLPSALHKDEGVAIVDETANGSSVGRFSKTSVETNSKRGSRNNGTESHIVIRRQR